MNANLLEKANRVIKKCKEAYLGVIDENGFPHVSTVSNLKPDGILEVYFTTGMESNKIRRLQKDKRASVCYHSGNDNITLVGEVEILTDQPTKSRMWESWFINHFPLGETDPNYCIIKFTTKRVSLWVGYESIEFMVDELSIA